jgi:hypothetical protein
MKLLRHRQILGYSWNMKMPRNNFMGYEIPMIWPKTYENKNHRFQQTYETVQRLEN